MAGVRRIHCSYHKCLTVYYKRVLHMLCNRLLPWGGGYRHYNSHLDDFHAAGGRHRVASINNRALDLDSLGSFRLSRFVRDPRDLVVSGYFYHRRGAEPWLHLEGPTEDDWYFANGRVPGPLRARGGSFASYLDSVSEEEGLLAELEFRRYHFDSMAEWPDEHPDVVTFRYEEVLGDEPRIFRELFAFYGLSALERALGGRLARRYALGRLNADAHVRDPAAGQWRRHFTPRVKEAFDARHASLLARLGYPPE